jgi:diaminopimelate decarboxylase
MSVITDLADADLTDPDVNHLYPTLWPEGAHRDASGVLHVGGVSTVDVAARFGTPAYLFAEAEFVRRCQQLRAAFSDFDIYYASKAFLCRTTARLTMQEGLRLDVCTSGELAVARDVGFPGKRMLLHGNNKSVGEIRMALRYGVGRIVIDSFDEIERVQQVAREEEVRPTVLVRVAVGVRADTHSHIATAHEDQKFGLSLASGDAAAAVRRIADADVVTVAGLHSHVGSQVLGVDGFCSAAARLAELYCQLTMSGIRLTELNLGGGYGIAYQPTDRPVAPEDMASALRTEVVAACEQHGCLPPRTLAIEPGRAVAGPAGCTLYTIGTVKPVASLRTYVAVDGGMSDNVRTALYDGVYSARLANRVSQAKPMLVRVVGKHCDAGDIVVRDEYLPADTRPGDLLAIPGTGAYCRSLSHNYNNVPRAPVVRVRDGEADLIIRRETEADLLRTDLG